jgi:hypothetical protein
MFSGKLLLRGGPNRYFTLTLFILHMLFQQAARARALFKAGLRSIQAIAEATLLELVKALYGSASWAGQGMHAEFAKSGNFRIKYSPYP